MFLLIILISFFNMLQWYQMWIMFETKQTQVTWLKLTKLDNVIRERTEDFSLIGGETLTSPSVSVWTSAEGQQRMDIFRSGH